MSYVDTSYYLSSIFTSESLSGLLISTQQAEKRALTQTQAILLCTPCTSHWVTMGNPTRRWCSNLSAQPFLILLWPALASHTEFCGGISKAESGGRGGGNEDLLPFCVNPAKGTDSIEAERALSSTPVHPVFGQKQLRGSKPTRTLAIWLHRRQAHLTTHGKSKSSLCPVEFWNPINFFPIFQNLQNEQLWIWNWHLPNNMVFVLPDMLVWRVFLLLKACKAVLVWVFLNAAVSSLKGNLKN